jgi:anaerobic magnesium-protoporphyrin IX monomethyl ester cyclase
MAKVLFVQDIVYDYFGVMYISAYLKKHGHLCDVVIECADKNWLKKAVLFNPDIIAFSVLTGSYKWALDRAVLLKNKFNKPVIFGGVHVFLNPDKSINESAVDIVCTGEGEYPMKELCDSVDSGEIDYSIKGLWFKMPDGKIRKNAPSKLWDNLDELPFPDRSIYWKYQIIAKRILLPIIGSRGCPYTCAYCFNSSARKMFEGMGRFIRERSSENILAEIEYFSKLSPNLKIVQFTDDYFGYNRKHSLSVLHGLSKLKNGKLKWYGAIRIESLNNEEYVKELSKTNHGILTIAIECGDEKYRKEILKRNITNEEIISAANLAKKYGIRLCTLNMLALPGETFKQSLMTLDLNIKIKPVYASCFVYQPYPGTELQEYAVKNKMLDESAINSIGLSFYDRYWQSNMNLNRIINLQRVFSLAVKFPFLKKPLVAMALNNCRISVDLIFGIRYIWYLLYYVRLLPLQIFSSFLYWLRS